MFRIDLHTYTLTHATTTKTTPNKVEFVSIQISWNCLLFVRMCDTIENDFFLFKFNFFSTKHRTSEASKVKWRKSRLSSSFFVWNPRQMSHKLLLCILVEMHQFVLQQQQLWKTRKYTQVLQSSRLTHTLIRKLENQMRCTFRMNKTIELFLYQTQDETTKWRKKIKKN